MIFFDRSIPRSVADALARVRRDVMWLEPTFPHDTPDVVWLAEAGARAWIVVTRDARIRTRPAERAALEANGVGVFVLSQRRPLTRWDVLKVVVANLDEIERLDRATGRPYLYVVSRAAGIRRLV